MPWSDSGEVVIAQVSSIAGSITQFPPMIEEEIVESRGVTPRTATMQLVVSWLANTSAPPPSLHCTT